MYPLCSLCQGWFSHFLQCITSLALITFLWAEVEDTISVLQFFGDFIMEFSEDLSREEYQLDIALLKGWCLVATTVDTDYVVDDLIPKYVLVSFFSYC